MTDPIRIANCSGFFGDRPSGAVEMVQGGPIDVLTGDWLAELTMLILARLRERRPGGGYARTFVQQMETVMGTCLDRGIKVVSNAGGLDPGGCADALAEVADRLGLAPSIAFVDGDDLTDSVAELMATSSISRMGGGALEPVDGLLAANAYLGCWGIVEALGRGADIVVTGRVTDAALTCGPAAWHHGWGRTDLDRLAGAVVAGHVIECSAQATGGNYSFFTEIPGWDSAKGVRFGFPWAEVAEDGSAVIGKHDGTGGVVTVGTVTSQLLYEIGSERYLGPDVTARFDTIALEQIAPDRVAITGTRGERPPDTLKVGINRFAGFKNVVEVALTGLDVERKAEFVSSTFWDACPFRRSDFEMVDETVVRTDHPDAPTQSAATAVWRLTVRDPDETKVGRAVTDASVQTALSSIPGMYGLGGGPSGAKAYGVFIAAEVAADLVPIHVHGMDGSIATVPSSFPRDVVVAEPVAPPETVQRGSNFGRRVVEAPLGSVVGARSGDKGGSANLGVFVRTAAAWTWLDDFLSEDKIRELLPESAGLNIVRHRFPNLWSLNFVIEGILHEGVAASVRADAQAKALGEWLRSRVVPIPEEIATSR